MSGNSSKNRPQHVFMESYHLRSKDAVLVQSIRNQDFIAQRVPLPSGHGTYTLCKPANAFALSIEQESELNASVKG